MSETHVLRLRTDELAAGRVVGRVESIRTGAASAVQSVDDLVVFLRGSVVDPAPSVDP